MADGSEQQPEAQKEASVPSPILGTEASPAGPAFDEEAAVRKLLPGHTQPAAAEEPASAPPENTTNEPASAARPMLPAPTSGEDEPQAPGATPSESDVAPLPDGTAAPAVESTLSPESTSAAEPSTAVRITPIAPLDTQSSPLVIDRGISVTDLAIRSGRRRIIEQASFTAAAGQVTALVGRAGSGKTAALLVLATLLRPTSGEIRMCGIDLLRQPADAHGLFGWAPQRPPAWEGMTVRRCLVATARLMHYSRAEGRDRAEVLIDLVGLSGLENVRVAVLSPAHQQLVSLAASLLGDPQVLLVDEPTSGLDHPTAAHLTSVLRALAAEGKAVLVTSQADETITDWTDRQFFLVDGVTASAQDVFQSLHSPRSWSIRTTEIISLVDALRSMRLPYSADEASGVATIVLENADAAALLLSKLSDVPITGYAPTLSTAEHIISTLEEERRA